MVGKTDDEVREWLGEPDWFGWEGVYRPKNYEEGLVAWNYVQSPGCEKHYGNSYKLHIKNGCLVGHSMAHHRSLVHFELPTIRAYNVDALAIYPLEAVITGSEVQRLYFPESGVVDLTTSEIDSGGHGSGTDAMGRSGNLKVSNLILSVRNCGDGTDIRSCSLVMPAAVSNTLLRK